MKTLPAKYFAIHSNNISGAILFPITNKFKAKLTLMLKGSTCKAECRYRALLFVYICICSPLINERVIIASIRPVPVCLQVLERFSTFTLINYYRNKFCKTSKYPEKFAFFDRYNFIMEGLIFKRISVLCS